MSRSRAWYKPQVRHRNLLTFNGPLAAASLALLSACSTPGQVGPFASAREAAVAAPTVPAQWHGRLPDTLSGQTLVGHDDPLLNTLVDEALAANLDLATARASLDRARALRDAAAAGLGPTLGSSGSASRGRSGGSTGNSLRAGLDASWEADVFGAGRASLATAQATADAAAATLQATRLAVAAEAALAYVQWQGLRLQIDVARASLDSQQQTRALVQARVQAGLASELERQQAATTLAQTEARLPPLQHSLSQAEHSLAVLLAQPPAALSARLAGAPRSLPARPQLPALALPADWLRRRPDLQAAELQARAALASWNQVQAERQPRFTLSGNLALQAASWSALGGSGAVLATLAAAVDWTLFDGGAGQARVAAQQATLDSARISWRAAVLAALQDVEDGLSALARGQQRVAHLARASASADDTLALARSRWQAGLVDFSVLLDAERTALSAADSLSSARTDEWLAHIRLLKSLGGGVGPVADTPQPQAPQAPQPSPTSPAHLPPASGSAPSAAQRST